MSDAVAGSLDGPFVVLLQQQRADQADDGRFVWKDTDDVAAPLDLAVEPLQGVGRVDLGAMLGRELHVGQHVSLRFVHEGSQFRHTRAGLICDLAPLLFGGRRVVLGEGGADPGRDDAALRLAGIHQGISHEVHAGAVEKALRF